MYVLSCFAYLKSPTNLRHISEDDIFWQQVVEFASRVLGHGKHVNAPYQVFPEDCMVGDDAIVDNTKAAF